MELHDEDVLEGIPDAEHIGLVIDGTIDMVTGNESHSLAHAQQYLAGALYASGFVSFSQYHGNEGFVDNVKAGIKKAWEYIVKMFKQLWGIFFKTDAKKKVNEANVALTTLEKSTHYHPTPGTARLYARELIKQGAKISHMDTDANAKAALESARQKEKELAAAPPVEQIKIVKEIEKEVHVIMDASLHERMEKLAMSTEAKIIHLNKVKDKLKEAGEQKLDNVKEDHTFYVAMTLEQVINGIKGWPDHLRNFKNMTGAAIFAGKTRACITAVSTNLGDFQQSEGYIKKRMDRIQQLVNQAAVDDEGKRELQHSLAELKKVMQLTSLAAILINDFLSGATDAANRYTVPTP